MSIERRTRGGERNKKEKSEHRERKERRQKNSPELLEHREQLRLHVLLADVEHPRVHEPLLEGQRGLPGLGGRDERRGERAGDEEAGEDVVVLAATEPDADLWKSFFLFWGVGG